MNADRETVHVAFGRSVTDTLREALSSLGCTERVIGLTDSLSVGPIDPPDPDVRRAWFETVLRVEIPPDDLDGNAGDVERAWADATSPFVHPVFWACMDCPMEHACLLAFTEHMRDRPFDIVDVTGLQLATADGAGTLRSLGQMRVRDIVGSDLHRRRRPASPEEVRSASLAWSKLRRENAAFRIVRGGCLVSAPLAHYDPLLVEQARWEWEVAAGLIGRTIKRLCSDTPTGQMTSDVVLFGRMIALGESGSLKVEGSRSCMRACRVRLPA